MLSSLTRLLCLGLLTLTPQWAAAQSNPATHNTQVVLTVDGALLPSAPAAAAFGQAPLDNPTARPTILDGRVQWSMAALEALPQHQFTTQTPWSHDLTTFSGPLLRDVLAASGAQGTQIRATAVNDYRIVIPADDAQLFDMVVATQLNGQPMSVRDKGPLFVVYPFDAHTTLQQARYYERSIWQLQTMTLE